MDNRERSNLIEKIKTVILVVLFLVTILLLYFFWKDMSFGDRHAKTSGELVLCFPERDADVWSVAKLYGESQRKIRLQNSIAEGETCIKKKFIVI